ncbi:MSC_0882 family membrane protein [Mycoplasma phocimorsus]|uniref:MSC_0882 family membrane protein n=1 Tax=Mycoplasma phocimorsus TaxID=3045839 RepID=UPI0024C03FBC|nr:hypothetical protein [Mycoplasma phocimorsus]MDJ1648252.1 hypothetical protein [Mycoplasma phocimorsus]
MNIYKDEEKGEKKDDVKVVTITASQDTNNYDFDISKRDELRAKEYKMPAALYKLHNSEVWTSNIKIIFNVIILLISISYIILQAIGVFFTSFNIKNTTWGWYMPSSAMTIISSAKIALSAIYKNSVNNQINSFKDGKIDSTVTPTFVGEVYIKSSRSNIINIWLTTWLNVYILIFIGIVSLLYYKNEGIWEIGEIGSNFYTKIDWHNILNNTFGSTVVLIVGFSVFLAVITVLAIIKYIYNYKKMKLVESYVPNNISSYQEKSNTKQLHKACLIISLVVLAIFISLIVIPLFILWKKRKRNG